MQGKDFGGFEGFGDFGDFGQLKIRKFFNKNLLL
jgi:hypothetical protein